MLAAFVPDFGREQSEAERGELIKAVVQALTILHGRAAGTVQAWQGAHRHELERRRNQEKYRGLLRTVVRAWREEADGRKAKTLRSVALRPGVERGAHPARMDTDTLSTVCSLLRVSGRGAGEELQQDLHKELLQREQKCESGSGVLPVARSAVPAGTQARLLLTYIRLVEGGRMQRDRRERVQRDAKGAPGAAQKDHMRRVERARAQSAAEGLLLPAEHGSRPVSAQGMRRRGQAIAQAERESAQGSGAAGEEGESSMGAARTAACAPAVAGAAAADAIDGDVQDGHHGFPNDATQGACSGQGGNGSVSSRARAGQGARHLQRAARQGGIAAQGDGEAAAVVDTRAVHGRKEQMAMDGSAPAAWQVDCEHRDGDEGEVDAQDVEESEEHQVVQQRDDEHDEDAAAMRAGRAGPSRRASGRTSGRGSSKKEENTMKAVEPSLEPLVTKSNRTKSIRLAEAESATTRRKTRATAAMESTDDWASLGGRGGRGRARGRGRGRGGRAGRGASTGRSAGRDG